MQATSSNKISSTHYFGHAIWRQEKTKVKPLCLQKTTTQYLLVLLVCAISWISQTTVWAVFYQSTGGLGGGAPRLIFVDAASADPGGGHNWDTAFENLQTALNVAHAHPGPVEIRIAGGTYLPSESDDQTATFLIERNDLIIKGSMRSGRSVLSGDIGMPGVRSDNSYHVVTLDGVNDTVILRDVDVLDGNAKGTGIHANGGGINLIDSTPRIEGCDLVFNQALDYGGAIFCGGSSSATWISDCNFIKNDSKCQGGAIYAKECEMILHRCTFESNDAEDSGGGIACESTDLYIASCTFTSNDAHLQYGGGICARGSDFFLTVSDSNFEENFAALAGGAVFAADLNILAVNLSNCEFKRNVVDDRTAGYGGGAYVVGKSRDAATIKNCTFFANSANEGGGLYARSMTVVNCHFRYNEAENSGGGVRGADLGIENCEFLRNDSHSTSHGGGGLFMGPEGSGDAPQIVNCTFAKNKADNKGGGVYLNESNAELVNCIIWHNSSSGTSDDDEIFVDGGFLLPSVNHSCVRGGWAGRGGWRIITDAPIFCDLGKGDLRLGPGSPCIDQGDDTWVSTTEDLHGNDRIGGEYVDFGAYEFHQ